VEVVRQIRGSQSLAVGHPPLSRVPVNPKSQGQIQGYDVRSGRKIAFFLNVTGSSSSPASSSAPKLSNLTFLPERQSAAIPGFHQCSLLGPFPPFHLLALTLCFFPRSLLCAFFRCGNARNDVIERVFHYPNAFYFRRTAYVSMSGLQERGMDWADYTGRWSASISK
jgi:hypothetical protein